MKPVVGKKYLYEGTDRYVTDRYLTPMKLSGTHILIKTRDSIWDRLNGRSMYMVTDLGVEVNIGRGSYIEEKCLKEIE
jgi:hypothetical protein